MPKFVFLATDIALLMLLAALAGYVWHVRRSPDLRATWRSVFRDAAAMSALVVLGAFILVAALDSLHFRPLLPPAPGAAADAQPAYSTRTYSVLDQMLLRQLEGTEKTYSAPLAYRSYSKESMEVDGKPVRDFPRLVHGGAHLGDPATQWLPDLLRRSAAGLAGGAVAALMLALVVAALHARAAGGSAGASWRAIWRRETEVPLRAVLLTAGALLLLVGWVAAIWGAYHVLGTDRTGNDVLYQALKSIRTAVVIGSLATLATLPFAIALGILAGYFKGWVDDAIQYLYTVLSSIPGVLLIAAFVLMIQVWIDKNPQLYETGLERADVRLLLLCVILGVTGWATLCRLLRAETLKLSELDYVQAARAFGVAHLRIMRRHIFPNLMHIVLIVAVLDFSALVLYEAVLSYVGVGVDPTTPSFGSMFNLARTEMSRDPAVWWNLLAAFVFLLALVLSANLFSGAVREAFDPRARAFRPRLVRGAAAGAAAAKAGAPVAAAAEAAKTAGGR
ncbi:MAG: ABC transporter permease [Burkholderiaceae bacterium]|nr:ABC transporter permease [Burkholderiaceae bacterium]